MEDIFKMIFTGENMRLVITLLAIAAGVIWLNAKVEMRFAEQDRKFFGEIGVVRGEIGTLQERMRGEIAAVRGEIGALREEMRGEIAAVRGEIGALREEMRGEIGTLREAINELKTNDIAHLYAAIEALTFTLTKNNTITEIDRNYIDARLKT